MFDFRCVVTMGASKSKGKGVETADEKPAAWKKADQEKKARNVGRKYQNMKGNDMKQQVH
jgi:hypothetical protein